MTSTLLTIARDCSALSFLESSKEDTQGHVWLTFQRTNCEAGDPDPRLIYVSRHVRTREAPDHSNRSDEADEFSPSSLRLPRLPRLSRGARGNPRFALVGDAFPFRAGGTRDEHRVIRWSVSSVRARTERSPRRGSRRRSHSRGRDATRRDATRCETRDKLKVVLRDRRGRGYRMYSSKRWWLATTQHTRATPLSLSLSLFPPSLLLLFLSFSSPLFLPLSRAGSRLVNRQTIVSIL